MAQLLAVDLGLRCGLASFSDAGQLLWYRSQHFRNMETLKRGVFRVIQETQDLSYIVMEGDAHLADIWQRQAAKRSVTSIHVAAESWRERLLLPREQRSGRQAKSFAAQFAMDAIRFLDAQRPTSLRHDAAEAICIGVWGLLEVGWLQELPRELCR